MSKHGMTISDDGMILDDHHAWELSITVKVFETVQYPYGTFSQYVEYYCPYCDKGYRDIVSAIKCHEDKILHCVEKWF